MLFFLYIARLKSQGRKRRAVSHPSSKRVELYRMTVLTVTRDMGGIHTKNKDWEIDIDTLL